MEPLGSERHKTKPTKGEPVDAGESIIVRQHHGGAAVLLEDGENTVLGSRWLDGPAREGSGRAIGISRIKTPCW